MYNNKPIKKPNYFIGFKIDNKEIQNNLETIINKLKLKYENIIVSKSFVLKERYHLTVLVMTLNYGDGDGDGDELNKVKILFNNIINKLYNEIYKSKQFEIKLKVNGLSTFSDIVFYASLKQDDNDSLILSKFVNSIRDQFSLNSIVIDTDHFEWVPHITLAKGSSIKPMLNDQLIKENSNKDFGTQHILSIDLMKIGSTDDENNSGYYQIIDSIKF